MFLPDHSAEDEGSFESVKTRLRADLDAAVQRLAKSADICLTEAQVNLLFTRVMLLDVCLPSNVKTKMDLTWTATVFADRQRVKNPDLSDWFNECDRLWPREEIDQKVWTAAKGFQKMLRLDNGDSVDSLEVGSMPRHVFYTCMLRSFECCMAYTTSLDFALFVLF